MCMIDLPLFVSYCLITTLGEHKLEDQPVFHENVNWINFMLGTVMKAIIEEWLDPYNTDSKSEYKSILKIIKHLKAELEASWESWDSNIQHQHLTWHAMSKKLKNCQTLRQKSTSKHDLSFLCDVRVLSKRNKKSITIKNANSFSLSHHLLCPTYKESQKIDLVTN